MPRKALIVYASITGNTEKVALRFKQVIDKKGWQCDILKVTKTSDRNNPPYRMEDYDLFLVGAPIWSGYPPLYLVDDHHGMLMPIMRPRTPGPSQGPQGLGRSIMEGYGPKKGVVFVTYGGSRRGTPQALPALSLLELNLEDAKVKCVGKFACPGGLWHEAPIDRLAAKFDWMVGDATEAVSRFKDNPNAAEFASLSPEDRKLFTEIAAEVKRQAERPGFHWNVSNRPSERDLLKAEIFMEEIMEDFYWEGRREAYPFSQSLCIA